jgi:hypothetical protein
MATKQNIKLGERRDYLHGRGWCRKVSVDGVEYMVGVEQGKRVRIAFKPRGPEGWGHHWYGFVRDAQGKRLWQGRVDKSTGARGLLSFARLIGWCWNEHDYEMICSPYWWDSHYGCIGWCRQGEQLYGALMEPAADCIVDVELSVTLNETGKHRCDNPTRR